MSYQHVENAKMPNTFSYLPWAFGLLNDDFFLTGFTKFFPETLNGYKRFTQSKPNIRGEQFPVPNRFHLKPETYPRVQVPHFLEHGTYPSKPKTLNLPCHKFQVPGSVPSFKSFFFFFSFFSFSDFNYNKEGKRQTKASRSINCQK